MSARVQSDPFDLASELAGFGAGAGAVVTFTGIVRDDGGMRTVSVSSTSVRWIWQARRE